MLGRRDPAFVAISFNAKQVTMDEWANLLDVIDHRYSKKSATVNVLAKLSRLLRLAATDPAQRSRPRASGPRRQATAVEHTPPKKRKVTLGSMIMEKEHAKPAAKGERWTRGRINDYVSLVAASGGGRNTVRSNMVHKGPRVETRSETTRAERAAPGGGAGGSMLIPVRCA